MEKSFTITKQSEHIEVGTVDDEIFIEVNYESDQGSGERGELFVFTHEEFQAFLEECSNLLKFARARKA